MHVPYYLNIKVGSQWTGLLSSQIILLQLKEKFKENLHFINWKK